VGLGNAYWIELYAFFLMLHCDVDEMLGAIWANEVHGDQGNRSDLEWASHLCGYGRDPGRGGI
jgi:hypothetical protein